MEGYVQIGKGEESVNERAGNAVFEIRSREGSRQVEAGRLGGQWRIYNWKSLRHTRER